MIQLNSKLGGTLLAFDTEIAGLLIRDLVLLQRLVQLTHDLPRLSIACTIHIEGSLVYR